MKYIEDEREREREKRRKRRGEKETDCFSFSVIPSSKYGISSCQYRASRVESGCDTSLREVLDRNLDAITKKHNTF